MKLKSYSLLLLFFVISNAFGQTSEENEKPDKWGCSVAINNPHSHLAYYGEVGLAMDADGNMLNAAAKTNKSYSLSVIPKCYISSAVLIRFEYGLTRLDLKSKAVVYNEGTSSYPTTYDTINQNINRFVLGVQYDFFKKKKFELFFGINGLYSKYSPITRRAYSEQRDISSDALISWGRSSISIPGGYATGVSVSAGLNVFLNSHFSLGTEFSYGLLYYNVGGKFSEEYLYQILPNTSEKVTNTMTNSYKGIRFTKIMPSFNLSVWF
ncbi:hypothetical protein BH10BAC1_BH10BAC1_15510 [soil metagenome]